LEDQIWLSPINLVIKQSDKDFRLSFHCFGAKENEKEAFMIENFNLYIK